MRHGPKSRVFDGCRSGLVGPPHRSDGAISNTTSTTPPARSHIPPRMHCYKAAPLIRALSQATPQAQCRDWQLASCTRQSPKTAALRPPQPVQQHSPTKLAQTLQHPHQAHRKHSRVGSPLGQRRSIGRRGRGQQRQAGHSSPAASQTNRQRRLEPQGFRRFFLAFEQ